MQTNDMDTDLRLRSMLEDVEVKPSRRVWKAVSARLDAEAAAAAPVSEASKPFFGPWMSWAGASLALSAAVVAAVLFLQPTPGTAPVELIKPESSLMTAMLEEQPLAEAPAEIVSETQEAVTYRRSAVKKNSPVVEVAALKQEEQIVTEEIPIEKETATETRRATKNNSRSTAESSNAAYADLFDTGEQHISFQMPSLLYAKGAIGGNSSDLAFNNKTAQLAPSLVPTTGISELSESTYGVPFTIGIGIRKYLLPKFSLGTGLDYSLLTRTFSGKYTEVSPSNKVEREESGSVFHSMSYIGIPLNFYYDVISSNKIDFYVYGGGEAEYCIANNYRLYSNPDINYSSTVNKLQYSVGMGLGVEFALGKTLGLYIDPEVKYYFHCDQPKNIRTEKPFMINFNAGLRFKL